MSIASHRGSLPLLNLTEGKRPTGVVTNSPRSSSQADTPECLNDSQITAFGEPDCDPS